MAKKTIISDFSALIGKVTFSGKSCDAKMTPKVKPTAVEQKSKVSEDGLKVGKRAAEQYIIRRGDDGLYRISARQM